MPALRKYSKVYDLPVHQSSTKDELTTVVANHWNTMVGISCIYPSSRVTILTLPAGGHGGVHSTKFDASPQ